MFAQLLARTRRNRSKWQIGSLLEHQTRDRPTHREGENDAGWFFLILSLTMEMDLLEGGGVAGKSQVGGSHRLGVVGWQPLPPPASRIYCARC